MKIRQTFMGLIGLLTLGYGLAEPANYNVVGQVIYEAKGPLGRFGGSNSDMGGILTWDPSNNTVSGEVCINLKAWKSGEPIRDDHTQTMFQVSRFPTACVKLGKLEGNPASGKITLLGTMSIHGINLPVRIPATLQIQHGKLVLEGRFSTRISDWGMERPSMMGIKIEEEVRVKINAEGVPVVAASR